MLDITELLYRQYKQLRDEAEELWNARYDLQLTSAEWYVMNNIYQGHTTASALMRQMDITKQAVHKFIMVLEEKELVQSTIIKAPKVQKKVQLTLRGQDVMEKSLTIQQDMEQRIAQSIGEEPYAQIKKLLQVPWIGQ